MNEKSLLKELVAAKAINELQKKLIQDMGSIIEMCNKHINHEMIPDGDCIVLKSYLENGKALSGMIKELEEIK